MTANEFWNLYLEKSGLKASDEEPVFSGELSFENDGAVGFEQLSLILLEKKTAFFSAFESFEINREPLPVVGEMYIVEDSDDQPCCIIEIDDVQVLPFHEVTWAMARQEGEDSGLMEWREKQREYMEDEAALCGFNFDDNSRVVFEHFHVVYRK